MSLGTKKSERTARKRRSSTRQSAALPSVFSLPHDKGELDAFKVVRVQAAKGDDSTKLAAVAYFASNLGAAKVGCGSAARLTLALWVFHMPDARFMMRA
jgi:hypothetical protein